MKIVNLKNRRELLKQFMQRIPRSDAYMLIFSTLFVVGVLAAIIWRVTIPFIHTFSAGDSSAYLLVAGLFGIPYSILAIQLISTVSDQYQEIQLLCSETHKKENRETYLVRKEVRINRIVYLCQGFLALAIACMLGLSHYDEMITGMIIIGCWMFSSAMLFVVAIALDDLWFIKVPKEFTDEVVEEITITKEEKVISIEKDTSKISA